MADAYTTTQSLGARKHPVSEPKPVEDKKELTGNTGEGTDANDENVRKGHGSFLT